MIKHTMLIASASLLLTYTTMGQADPACPSSSVANASTCLQNAAKQQVTQKNEKFQNDYQSELAKQGNDSALPPISSAPNDRQPNKQPLSKQPQQTNPWSADKKDSDKGKKDDGNSGIHWF